MNIKEEYEKLETSSEDLADKYISLQQLTKTHIKNCLTSIRGEARKFEENFRDNPNYWSYEARIKGHIRGLDIKLLVGKNDLEETI